MTPPARIAPRKQEALPPRTSQRGHPLPGGVECAAPQVPSVGAACGRDSGLRRRSAQRIAPDCQWPRRSPACVMTTADAPARARWLRTSHPPPPPYRRQEEGLQPKWPRCHAQKHFEHPRSGLRVIHSRRSVKATTRGSTPGVDPKPFAGQHQQPQLRRKHANSCKSRRNQRVRYFGMHVQ